MYNLIPIFFVASTIIYFFFSKNIKHFLFFGIIFFNVFSFKGYGLLDEFFLFLALIFLIKNEFKKIKIIKKYLNDCIINFRIILKRNYLYLFIFILIIYYLFLTLEGIIAYDLRIFRYFLFFILILFYLFFNEKFNFNILSLKNSIFITNTTTFVFLLYLLQGIYYEIWFIEKLSRYLSQGDLVSGSSMAFAILIFSTIPALKIYKYKPLNTILFLIVVTSNIIFWDSRVGSMVFTILIIINFFKKIYIPILCVIFSVIFNLIIEFTAYYLKYEKVFLYHEYKCEKSNFNTSNKSCMFKNEYDNVLFALHRVDEKYWKIRPYVSKLQTYYKNNYFNGATEVPKKSEFFNDLFYTTLLQAVKSGVVDILEEPSNNLFKENILINPSLSDHDRMVPVIASIDLIINNPSLIRKIFGYGFYSHKEELVEPINKALVEKKILSKYSDIYYEKAIFPIRTANLPAIITDGGIFLVIIYFVIFSIIGLRIVKNLKSINKSNFSVTMNSFLNKGLIISFIFFLNYINFNLDCVFIYMILINPNHFTDFDFNA